MHGCCARSEKAGYILEMEWCIAIRHIAACSTSLQEGSKSSGDGLTTLLAYLYHDDLLVAYAAKEKLRKLLESGEVARVHDVINAIFLAAPTTWQSETSGFYCQLLRQLIQVKRAGGSGKEKSQEGCSLDEWDHIQNFPYLEAMTKCLMQMETMVRCIFIPTGGLSTAASHSVQYETLVFISALVKGIQSRKISRTCRYELCGLMTMLMKDVFVKMDYCSQPAFVSCAVLDLLGDFHRLVSLWNDQTPADKERSVKSTYQKWLGECLTWLIESSCTTTALKLLDDRKVLNMASCEAFIAMSSVYPFLQQWLLFLSRIGMTVIETFFAKSTCSGWKRQPASLHLNSCAQHQLPSRQQLFAVLVEQDDMMIEVLNNITRMADKLDGIPGLHAQEYLHFTTHVVIEYDQDLLFADLVDTLGGDHLVLLDLIVSNETQMLEYLMRYLRRLSTTWHISKQKLRAVDRLDGVMSILIRLRLEIDRLVAADLFPYGAKPLTRRLVTIEQFYEGPDE